VKGEEKKKKNKETIFPPVYGYIKQPMVVQGKKNKKNNKGQ
jgi:hypothetical protein